MVKAKIKFKSKAGRIRKPKKTTRWAKGDSCLSNPEIHKFRDEASSLYFHEVVKNPLLTARNLGSRNVAGNDIDEDVLSADVQSLTVSDAKTGYGSFASYKTFASDWSKCSNGAFEKFLGRFKLDSALHKEMLSILAATTDVINSLGGTHRETEYFASFVTALDQCETSQYPAMMALLSIVSGKVPEVVLRRTFSTIYPKVGCVLSYAMESFDSSLMRVCCDVLKKILGAQDPNIFESELPVQSLIYGILRCALHDNPKVRRKARTTIGFILNRQKEKNGNDSVAKIVLGWVLDQLATYPTCGSKAAGDTVGLLQFVWSNLDSVSSAGAKKLYESVLRIMSSGDMSLVKIGFSFFSVVFQTHLTIDSSSLSRPENIFTPKLVAALWDFCPDWRNNDAFLLWLNCMMNGLIRLTEDDFQFTGPYISRLMEAIAPTWTSHWGAIPSKVFVDYLFHLLQPGKSSNEDIEACFQVLSKNLISIPPNEHCLTVLIGFLDSLKPEQFTISGREVLLQLLQLRNSSAAPKINSILGHFVKSFGIDNLWISVDPDIRHTVILPLLRDNLSGDQLLYWKEHIFPLHKNPAFVKDVWGSLVGFCRNPTDPENFPAKFIGETGIKTPEYRLTALAVLRQFCLWPQAKPILQKHANHFLAILFNEYISERQVALKMKTKTAAEQWDWKNSGHSDAIGTTVQEYLPVVESKLIQELLGVAIKKFNGATVEEKGPILDLVGFLSIFPMDPEIESQVFEIASTLISDPIHMKRAYRLLQSLLNNESVTGEIVAEIVGLLSASKGKTKSNAEPLRLECIISLLLTDESWWAEFLPEAILSLLSVNTRARRVAIKFVAKLCESLKEQKISLEKLEKIVKLGLESGNCFIISCTLHFLTRVYGLAPPVSPDETLINNCVNHLLKESGWDAGVSREALSFISLNLSLYKSKMGPFAGSIGKILSVDSSSTKTLGSEGFPRKEINKILGRMIRVFGVAGLRAVLPNADDPKMTTRIKNIQRKIRKMKESRADIKKRESEKDLESDGGESEEDEEEDGKSRRSHLAHQIHRPNEKLLMKEGVVDFLDPKNMTASLISKPKEMKEGDDFKFSSDGKLIIEDLDGRGKKRKLEEDNSMGVESDDEDDLDDDELEGKKRKKARARGGSSVASSKRSMKSSRTMRSVSSKKSGKSSGGVSRKTAMANRSFSMGNRPQLKARRSRKGGSNQSVRSMKSGKSLGGQKERFNYKR